MKISENLLGIFATQMPIYLLIAQITELAHILRQALLNLYVSGSLAWFVEPCMESSPVLGSYPFPHYTTIPWFTF